MWYGRLLDSGYVPDVILRKGIRRLLAERLREESGRDRRGFLEEMERSPVALHTGEANRQHYEVPAQFYEWVLGPRLKYSSGLWSPESGNLAQAEEAMLELYGERAQLADGQRVLELGCGWGSLSLWMAERFPRSHITAVSNSASQREFIGARAARKGLTNLHVVTCDMNRLGPAELAANGTFQPFERVVSVEMFEHMRNWGALFERLTSWLAPDAVVFLHVFAHREYAYPYEVDGRGDWMAEHFFTGGLMPSADLVRRVTEGRATEAPGQPRLVEDQAWEVSGTHYQHTAEAWLAGLDRVRRERPQELRELFEGVYGPGQADTWIERWRIFFMACAELWGYGGGKEWIVSHHRLRLFGRDRSVAPPPDPSAPSASERS